MDENKQEQKMGFFKRIYNSIFHFNSYSYFVVEKPKKTLAYFLKLILLVSVIYSIIIVGVYYFNINESLNYFKNDIPDFTIVNGEIQTPIERTSIEKTIAGNNILLLIDTSENEKYEENKKQIEIYDIGILFSNDKVEIKLKNLSTWDTTFHYLEGGDFYTKQDVIDIINGYNIQSLVISCVVLSTFLVFILFLTTILPYMAIWCIVAWLSNVFNRVRLKLRAIVTIVVYSYTLAIVLQLIFMCINVITGFVINNFDIMIILISAIYLFTALIYVRTHAISEQILISKMKYEQEKQKDNEEVDTTDEQTENEDEE